MINEDSIVEYFNSLNEERRYGKIAEINAEQMEQYEILLEEFIESNGESGIKTVDKGDSLEKLVSYLLEISGDIFTVERNIKTNTNEIDQFITLKPKGKFLLSHGYIDRRYEHFLGECKNYSSCVSVTYVRKFYSLMVSGSIKLGILFSYYGLSGRKWACSSGLVRKLYMSKENNDEKYVIIDFNLNDFKSIINGVNFLEIVDGKIKEIMLDTDYSKLITTHPAEKQL